MTTDDATTTPKPAPRKRTATKKTAEFAPIVKENGKLDHTNCSHERTPKGRSACRAAHAKMVEGGKR